MSVALTEEGERYVLPASHLGQLIDILRAKGYQVIAPTVRDEAIVLEPIDSVEELPRGYYDEQQAGSYQLKRSSEEPFFAHTVGAHTWKRYLYPPRLRLWQAQRTDSGFECSSGSAAVASMAFVGVRPCDWAAIKILDKVLLGGEHPDEYYRLRREQVLIVVVNCTHPSGNCFCSSLGTGPVASSGADLVLTEVCRKRTHFFLVQAGSERGKEVVGALQLSEADETQWRAAQQAIHFALHRITKHLDTAELKTLLYAQVDSEHWEEVAKRCLTCANCTMVCPTCFCHRVEDYTDLSGKVAERWRRWDSCFHIEFSYIHGSAVRVSVASRYRQWLTHKLAAWQDQFGSIGCVGCGRCITWCPVGIDITEEVRALRRRAVSKEESHANA